MDRLDGLLDVASGNKQLSVAIDTASIVTLGLVVFGAVFLAAMLSKLFSK